MKKLLTLALALLLACSLFGCTKTENQPEGGDEPTEKTYKVAMLIPFIGDQSYFDTMEKGRKAADAKYENVETRLIEVGNTTEESVWMNAFDEVCEDGEYDLVISANESYEQFLYAAAKKYPNQLFLNCDYSNCDTTCTNVLSVTFGLDHLGYVIGALSAKLTKTGTVGVVVGKDAIYMNNFISGYVQVLADQGVKYVIAYPNSFTDTVIGKELTQKMIEQGADVIWQVAGGLGNGVIDACSENPDVWCVGVDQDQYVQFEESHPEWAKTIITSALKNTDVIIETVVDWLVAGTLQEHMGKQETWGIKENGVGIAENDYYKANCPAEVQTQLAEILADVADGKVEVANVFAMDYENDWPTLRDANILTTFAVEGE